MSEKIKVNFYNIARCGYFERGIASPRFGDIQGTLVQLYTWVTQQNFPLEQNCTYNVDENCQILRTFCFDIAKNATNTDFLLTTWNEVPSHNSNVAAVPGDKDVGEATIELTELREGTIPGYPTFFWFLPQQNIFATIRFDSTLNGHNNLTKYILGFLEKHSAHTIHTRTTNGIEISGYSLTPPSPTEHVTPSFKSFPLRKRGEIEYIRANYTSIQKIIRRATLELEIDEELAIWQKLLLTLGMRRNPSRETQEVEYSLKIQPSPDELQDIIDNWEHDHTSSWNDVGFKLVGESTVRWLKNMLVKTEIEIPIDRDSTGIIKAQALLDEITRHKTSLTSVIPTRDD